MAKATPTPISTPNLQDIPIDEIPEKDLGAPLVIADNLAEMLGDGHINAKEMAYLIITERYTRMGRGRGCYLTVREFSRILKVNRSGVFRIRDSLLGKGLLVRAKGIPVRGQIQPVFKTWWSDAFYPPVPYPPRLTAQDAPPSYGARPNKKENTKDTNTRGVAAPRPPKLEETSVFVETTRLATPEEKARAEVTDLAHRFWRWLRDHQNDLPPKERRVPVTFPKSEWPKKFAKITKLEGGVPAVSSMLDRLIKMWPTLSPEQRSPNAGLFCSPNYFLYVLPKLLGKQEKATTKVVLTAEEQKVWEWVKTEAWPGRIADVKRCFVETFRSWVKVKKVLAALKADSVVGVAAKRVHSKISEVMVVDVMKSLANHAQYAQQEFGSPPDYDSSAYTLGADVGRHKVFKKYLNYADPKMQPVLVAKLKEVLARG